MKAGIMRKDNTSHNRPLAKRRVQRLNERSCPHQADSVLVDSLVLRNLLLRQAPKRKLQPFEDSAKLKLSF